MPSSLESNSASDLNMDPILYLTYLHNGTGQEFFFPALPYIATLSFLSPLDAAKQAELARRVYRSPKDFFFSRASRQARSEQSCTLTSFTTPHQQLPPSPAEWPCQDEPCRSPRCFCTDNFCLDNCSSETERGMGTRIQQNLTIITY